MTTLAHRGQQPLQGQGPAQLALRTSSAPVDVPWDAFLASTPGSHHTQTSLWGQVKATMGWRVVRVVAERDGLIVGGAQVLHRRIAPGAAIGYVHRGPVLAEDTDQVGAAVMAGLGRVAREQGIRHLAVQPWGFDEAAPPYLRGREHVESAVAIAPRATVLVDVSREPEEILAGMSSSMRYNVRLSGRKSVTVREGGREDLAAYLHMLEQTAARQRFAVQPKVYFEHLWDVLAPAGQLRLSLAEYEGRPLAGQLAIGFGDTVVNKLSVWSGEEGGRKPNEALHWGTIRWAHEQGFRWYDLEGVKLQLARAVLAGTADPARSQGSVAAFKLRFGGQVVVTPGAHVLIPNRMLRYGFAELYPRLSGHRSVKRLVKGLRTRAGRGDR